MKVEKIICDCCGEEIPTVKKKDIFGIEREYYRFGKLNYGEPFTDINCHNLGLDLCERCAGNISLEMYKTKMEMLNGGRVNMDISTYMKKYGIKEVKNDYGETRCTREGNIVFSNGWVASIVENVNCPEKGKYSIAMCDYNGYFNWEILNKYGAEQGKFYCNTDTEIISICEIIRNL